MSSELSDGRLPTVEQLMRSLEDNQCPLLGDELAAFASAAFCAILEVRITRSQTGQAALPSRAGNAQIQPAGCRAPIRPSRNT